MFVGLELFKNQIGMSNNISMIHEMNEIHKHNGNNFIKFNRYNVLITIISVDQNNMHFFKIDHIIFGSLDDNVCKIV